jgi:hypothetical protein
MTTTEEALAKERAEAKTTAALQAEFAKFHESGIKPNVSDPELLALLKEGRHITVEDSTAYTVYDGEKIAVGEALKRFVHDRREFVDGRTLPREGVTGRPGVTSKADLKTFKEKVAYVNKFGEAAFLALPLTGQVSSEIRTFEDFRKLPIEEKNRLINADPNYMEKLKPSPGHRMPGQAFINHELLERQKAIRPASRGKR